MPQSVYVPLPINKVTAAEELPSKTYRLDLDAGRIVGTIDGIEAVQQAIRKAIITPRFKCLIYDNNYGSEIKEAITAKDASQQYTMAAIPGFVRDCLKPDSRILKVDGFEFRFEDDAVFIAFDAYTIYGKIRVEGVM